MSRMGEFILLANVGIWIRKKTQKPHEWWWDYKAMEDAHNWKQRKITTTTTILWQTYVCLDCCPFSFSDQFPFGLLLFFKFFKALFRKVVQQNAQISWCNVRYKEFYSNIDHRQKIIWSSFIIFSISIVIWNTTNHKIYPPMPSNSIIQSFCSSSNIFQLFDAFCSHTNYTIQSYEPIPKISHSKIGFFHSIFFCYLKELVDTL